MPLKIDTKDKRILALLDENCRATNTQIAKRVGLSKPAVEYRIRRLERNDAIFAHYAVIDFSKLGYSQYKLYCKFQNTPPEDEQRMLKYWTHATNAIWVASLRGSWDMAVSILARSNFEFGRILSEFFSRFAQFILQKDVLMTEYSPIYAREYLTGSTPKEFIYGLPGNVVELDQQDMFLLKTLSNNARMSIVDLMKKTALTRDIVTYRLRKYEKEKLIVQYRCYPNLPVIGIQLHKIVIRTKNLDERSEKELGAYAANSKRITQFLKLIGSWDIEIEVETESEDQLYALLAEIRKRFANIIREYDLIRITKTLKYTYFPF